MKITSILALSTAITLSLTAPSYAQLGGVTGSLSGGASASGSSSGSSGGGALGATQNLDIGIGRSDSRNNDNRDSGTGVGARSSTSTSGSYDAPSVYGGIGVDNSVANVRTQADGAIDGVARSTLVDLDTDKNGSLSVSEFGATGRADQQVFSTLDTDKNGILSDVEFSSYTGLSASGGGNNAAVRASNTGWLDFGTLDHNNNGKLTNDEFVSQRLEKTLFTKLDANHDGNLNQTEIDAYAGSSAQAGGGAWVDFKSLDVDANGRITGTEFNGKNLRTKPLFEKLDSDRDGTLTQAEINAYAGTNVNTGR